jgi:iron only hydrogenase large subunit-like protein
MTVPPLVSSIPDRCRVCYACVRECPAKAIRILHGQAAVVAERCIGCGNCVRVCSQGAKAVLDGTAAVRLLLHGPAPVAVLVAPSFPAEFADCGAAIMVGMLRRLGFARVCETAFGADLVAREYRRTFTDHPDRHYIATTCPAVVAYIEYYRPHLLPRLMPVVSPMVAAARVLRAMDANLRIVFVGPCIAKKAEALSEDLDGEVDAVLTFAELRAMFQEQAIAPHATAPSELPGAVACSR